MCLTYKKKGGQGRRSFSGKDFRLRDDEARRDSDGEDFAFCSTRELTQSEPQPEPEHIERRKVREREKVGGKIHPHLSAEGRKSFPIERCAAFFLAFRSSTLRKTRFCAFREKKASAGVGDSEAHGSSSRVFLSLRVM